jgi:predicted enzyme related to lactoylglutathione lyase
VFAGIHVSDLEAAVAWYEGLTGRAPDLVPNEREAAWRMTASGWLCLIADGGRAGSAQHTILVDDLDAAIAELERRGIAAGAVEPVGPGGRRTLLRDPDRNSIALAQVDEDG